MLEKIHIENLKCFRSQSISLEALTLLTGFNASGKSTVIQTMLLASQMSRCSDGSKYIPLNGPLVSLGSVGDVLNEFARSRKITIGFEGEGEALWFRLSADSRHSNSIRVDNSNEIASSEIELKNRLRELIFISTMRLGTKDVFPVPEEPVPVNADVGSIGEYAPWWFETHLGDIERERLCPTEKAPTLRRQFNAWAAELFPGSQANAIRLTGTSLVQLQLRMRETDGWRRPMNIGYGLTYAFPILVAGLIAKKGQILVVDSPEAHLHPRGQSKIGEFLAVVAASGVQVVLETHSDHVLNGIRLAVFKKKIGNKNLVIHFFSTNNVAEPPNIMSPLVDRAGNLSEWPEGFFDQSDKDLASLVGWDTKCNGL